MKLSNIKLFSQADSRWGSLKLRTSTTSTVKSDGCLLCCVATTLNYFGKEITPDRLNDDITRVKGWYQACRLTYGSITEIYPDITVDWNNYIECADTGAPLDKIDAILVSGRIPIVKVDFNPKTSALEEHWVCIIGKDEANSYIIMDPIDGSEQYFQSRYGDPSRYIFKIVTYSGPIPEGGVTIESLNAHIQELTKQITDQISANAELRNINVKLQGEIAETDKINQQLVEDNRKAEMARINAENNASDLQGKLDSSRRALEDCLALYNASQEIFMTKTPSVDFVKELIRRFLRRR